MNETRPQAKVTLEDVLRIKRAERPPAEFWVQFEQELRAKQLAAILEKKVWWHRLPRAFAGLARFQVPLGATAVLALTFVTMREYQDPAASQRSADLARSSFEPVASAPAAPGPMTLSELTREREESASRVSSPTEREAAGSSLATVSAPAPAFAEAGPSTFAPGAPQPTGGVSPSARSIAANLAAAGEVEPELTQLLGGNLATGFEARALPARAASTEPLAQMAGPRDARRARLFASMLGSSEITTNTPAGADRTRERLTSRLNEQQLYDQVSRLGVGGDRFTLKF